MEFDAELSFSESLTTIFIMVIYGYMMPLIIPASLLQLIVIFYRDKLLVSNTYIFLSFVDTRTHKYIRNLLVIAFFFSAVLNLWVFGNPRNFSKHYSESDMQNTALNHFRFEETTSSTYTVTPTAVNGDFGDFEEYLSRKTLPAQGYSYSFSFRGGSDKI